MGFTWGKKSIKRAEGIVPLLWQCATISLARCKHYDQSVQWRGGVRSAEQQKEIYGRGASTKDGYNKLSYHQIEATPENKFGMALDVAPSGISMGDLDKMVKGQISEHPGFREFAKCMFMVYQELQESGDVPDGWRLEWGGFWGMNIDKPFIDLPHWQIKIYK